MHHKKAVDISGLMYTYPDAIKALDDVSLCVHAGEKVAVIGPNGAGKSTLLMHMNGILNGTGSVIIGGIEVKKSTLKQVRKLVGFVFQNPEDQLFSATVFDDIAFGLIQFGLPKDTIHKKVEEVLEHTGIQGIENRSPFRLSYGQQKMAALATVLVLDPHILVLDEPGSNLDPKHRRKLLDFLKNDPTTIVIATHDLDFAAELCDRTLILYNGKIVADGKSRDILSDKPLLEKYDLELPLGSYY
ncbi:energy-coupling factor ABC transporter ATP-binding protein [candidate division KSB1 bacterium]